MKLLQIELYKIFKRPRTYISYVIIAAIAFIIQLALYADGDTLVKFMLQGVPDFVVHGKIINGYFVTYIILQTLLVNVPLLVALVAGDALAGEANLGTLRLLLTKPISRSKLVLVKFFASVIYSMTLLIWLAIIGLVLSLLIFGVGDMISFKSNMVVIMSANDVVWRYLAAFAFAGIAMTTVASLAIFLSAITDNAIGPIIGTIGIIIIFTLFSTLGLPLYDSIKPYLFTTHMLAWKGFFYDPVPYSSILTSALVLLGYIAFFITTTIIYFNRKDITS